MNEQRKFAHLVTHISEMKGYAPEAHTGTTNIILSDRAFCPNFELVLGRVRPGGSAVHHYHDKEAQVVYVISGEGEVTIGDDPPMIAGAGTVVRIPPGVDHGLMPLPGDNTWEVLIVYSPPISHTAEAFKKRGEN
ncbi:cupin domain-containing protein [Cupriavidus necator]